MVKIIEAFRKCFYNCHSQSSIVNEAFGLVCSSGMACVICGPIRSQAKPYETIMEQPRHIIHVGTCNGCSMAGLWHSRGVKERAQKCTWQNTKHTKHTQTSEMDHWMRQRIFTLGVKWGVERWETERHSERKWKKMAEENSDSRREEERTREKKVLFISCNVRLFTVSKFMSNGTRISFSPRFRPSISISAAAVKWNHVVRINDGTPSPALAVINTLRARTRLGWRLSVNDIQPQSFAHSFSIQTASSTDLLGFGVIRSVRTKPDWYWHKHSPKLLPRLISQSVWPKQTRNETPLVPPRIYLTVVTCHLSTSV